MSRRLKTAVDRPAGQARGSASGRRRLPPPTVRVAPESLILAIVVAFAIWLFLQLLQRALWVLVLVLLAAILAAAMMPIVKVMQKPELPPGGWHIPKPVAVVMIYVVTAILLSIMAYFVGATIVSELVALIDSLPSIVEGVAGRLREFEQTTGLPIVTPSPEQVQSQVERLSTRLADALQIVVTLAGGIVDFIFRFFIVIALALFLVAESEHILGFWVSLFPPKQRQRVHVLASTISNQIGRWVLGQLAVATITGTLAGLGSALLGLPYPALLGLATAFLDLAPVLGPTLMVFPAFLLGLSQGPLIAIVAVIFYYALAEFDGNVLSPLITGRAVQISPSLVIVAVPIGLALYGAVGALIAVPVAAGIQVIVNEVVIPWLHHQEQQAEEEAEIDEREAGERAA